jgi:hypothetical protein
MNLLSEFSVHIQNSGSNEKTIEWGSLESRKWRKTCFHPSYADQESLNSGEAFLHRSRFRPVSESFFVRRWIAEEILK